MRRADRSRADRYLACGDRDHAEVVEGGTDSDDIGDRVERADLVEVHLVRGHAVHGGFRLREPGKDLRGPDEDGLREGLGGAGEHLSDVAPGAVRLIRNGRRHLGLAGAQPGPAHLGGGDPHRAGQDRVDRLPHPAEVGARVDQRAEQHVPGDPGRGVDPQVGHRGAVICAARWPAP